MWLALTCQSSLILHPLSPLDGAFLIAQSVKNPPAIQETRIQFLGWEDPLEKGKATRSSILAWRIPWTVACQAPLFMGFSRQECWSGFSFISPGDLPNPEIESGSPVLQADSLLTEL